MESYSNKEYADIMYCFADGNAAGAHREYQRCFPDHRLPHVSVFGATYQGLNESSTIHRNQVDTDRPRRLMADDEEIIVQHFIYHPNVVVHWLDMSEWKPTSGYLLEEWLNTQTGGLGGEG
ncbi:unnamed protein product [Parnassius apollo]|uniref:(apollo) hypothetical protein n=1 Tax=Parnassius apollo TaxID=110799 RepID=A0A8S3X1Z2_PARAO|nr:unnamed protein product [Parnassius apollo]